MNVVIMAGGGGTRLWPLSRKSKPKQFLDFGTDTTLIERAYARAAQVTSPDRIYVATNQDYAAAIKKLLPQVPAEHVFLEPERRDTTAAFAAIAARLTAAGEGETPTTFLWSDHIFTAEEAFVTDLQKINGLVQTHPNAVVIMAHTPTTPDTKFGYVEGGDAIGGDEHVVAVKAFKEKPDLETAKSYVAAGTYFWNLGYFSLRPSYLLDELTTRSPELTPALEKLTLAANQKSEEAFTQAFSEFPKVAIEYTFIEKTPKIIAVTGDYGWSDVGNWSAVAEIFGASKAMPKGHHIHVDSEDNYIYSTTDTAVSLIGIKNAVIIVTEDAILVADKSEAHRVKEVVERLQEEHLEKLL